MSDKDKKDDANVGLDSATLSFSRSVAPWMTAAVPSISHTIAGVMKDNVPSWTAAGRKFADDIDKEQLPPHPSWLSEYISGASGAMFWTGAGARDPLMMESGAFGLTAAALSEGKPALTVASDLFHDLKGAAAMTVFESLGYAGLPLMDLLLSDKTTRDKLGEGVFPDLLGHIARVKALGSENAALGGVAAAGALFSAESPEALAHSLNKIGGSITGIGLSVTRYGIPIGPYTAVGGALFSESAIASYKTAQGISALDAHLSVAPQTVAADADAKFAEIRVRQIEADQKLYGWTERQAILNAAQRPFTMVDPSSEGGLPSFLHPLPSTRRDEFTGVDLEDYVDKSGQYTHTGAVINGRRYPNWNPTEAVEDSPLPGEVSDIARQGQDFASAERAIADILAGTPPAGARVSPPRLPPSEMHAVGGAPERGKPVLGRPQPLASTMALGDFGFENAIAPADSAFSGGGGGAPMAVENPPSHVLADWLDDDAAAPAAADEAAPANARGADDGSASRQIADWLVEYASEPQPPDDAALDYARDTNADAARQTGGEAPSGVGSGGSANRGFGGGAVSGGSAS